MVNLSIFGQIDAIFLQKMVKLSLQNFKTIENQVCKLIQNRYWCKEKLDKVFYKEETEQIMRIPVIILGKKDRFYCNETENGQYSVKTGYELTKRMKAANKIRSHVGETNSQSNRKKVWISIWDLKIKHKIKHFL